MLTQVLPTGSYSDELVHAILVEKLNQSIVPEMTHAVFVLPTGSLSDELVRTILE